MILEFRPHIRRADNPQVRKKILLESRSDIVKCAAFVRTRMPAILEARETRLIVPRRWVESILSVFEILAVRSIQ
jgi:hypothetical protein